MVHEHLHVVSTIRKILKYYKNDTILIIIDYDSQYFTEAAVNAAYDEC